MADEAPSGAGAPEPPGRDGQRGADGGPEVPEPPVQWRNLPPLGMPDQPAPPRGNSPFAIIGVLALVLVVVLALGSPGKFTTTVEGVAVPGPALDTKPNAAAPHEPTSSTAPAPRAQVALEANRLLDPGMKLPAVTCRATFGRSAEQLRAYYQALIGCLDEAWKPVLAQANQPWESPSLSVDDAPTTSCSTPSKQEAVAFYCPRDKKIFMPRDRALDSMGTSQGSHINVLAHEYGHHIQALSGINDAFYRKVRHLEPEAPEFLESARRMELQADCFSGMFIATAMGRGSISKAIGNSASEAFRRSVTDKTHGTVKNQIKWGTAGVKNNNTASCNTWSAPVAEVS